MRKVVFFLFLLYFQVAWISGSVLRSKKFSRTKRRIDLKSSLEHVSDVRLPRNVMPIGYNLELHPFIGEEEFQGHVIINMTCLEDTDKIILHAHQELEIVEGDISAYLMSSSPLVEELKATDIGTVTLMNSTPDTATAFPPMAKTTELNVAAVPVGAARLLPVSSSFIPDNACTSISLCATNPGQEKSFDNMNKKERLPEAESLMYDMEEEAEEAEDATSKATLISSKRPIGETKPESEPTSQKSLQPFLIPLTVTKTERQLSKQWYIIYVSGGLKRGENYQLNLKFTGALLTNSQDGFFVETYLNSIIADSSDYVATHLRPSHARRVFPCFDEPSYKVPFELHIARKPNLRAISNMPVLHTEQSLTGKEWVWDHFQPSPPMSTFSLALLISDLQRVRLSPTQELGEEPDRVRVWGRIIMFSPLKKAAKIAPKVVSELEKFFGMPMPVPKLDLVALPGYTAVSDSNLGVIFLTESDLFIEEPLTLLIAREIVYQWIGNLITPHWWTEVHINKALCNFIAYLVSIKVDDSLFPNSGLWTKTYPLYYEYGRIQPYKLLLSQEPPKTVTKSELILRMLNYTLSVETFQKAIQQLLRERQYKTFTQDHIWGLLTQQAGMDGTLPEPATVNQIADSWIKRERLPLVTVNRNYEKNSALVTQNVFIRDHLYEDSTDVGKNLTWIVPLVVVHQNNLNFTNTKPAVWMKAEKEVTITDLPSSSFFIIVNPEEIGPFIVNYDLYNWNLLSEFLEKYANNGQIPPATRAKLIYDSLSLAYAGKLRFGAALNMTKFLLKERDPIVWQAALNMFDHIQRYLDGISTSKKFQEYTKYLLADVYSYLEEMETRLTKSQERMYESAKSALCNAGYKPCIKEARIEWKKWMDCSYPDYKNLTSRSHFCWVFKWGTTEEWEYGLERFLKYLPFRDQDDRYYLLKTLVSCPSTTWKVERLLNMTMLDPNTTATELNVRFILTALSNYGTSTGYVALFNFLSNNWDALRNRFDNKESGLWNNIVSAATRNFKDQDGLDMVSELYVDRQGEFGSAESVIEQSLRHVKKEVKWNDDNLPEIDLWLTDYLSERAPISPERAQIFEDIN